MDITKQRHEQIGQLVINLDSAISDVYGEKKSQVENIKQLFGLNISRSQLVEMISNYVPDQTIIGQTNASFPVSKSVPAPKEHTNTITLNEIKEYVLSENYNPSLN